MTLRDSEDDRIARTGIQTRTGRKWSAKKTPKKQNKKNKLVDQAEGMLHLRDTIKTQASDDKKWECHIYPTVF